jgi:pimeloyl-ACP methyl ester carboxylesterase
VQTRVTQAPASAASGRVLMIPGLDGDASMLQAVAPWLFGGMRVLAFDHRFDMLDGGVEGLAERALAVLDSDPDADAPALVCGESFGGTAALTLAYRHPARVRGLILLSAFGWYPKTFACWPRLHLGLWRIVGDVWARRLLRLWRPFTLPGALGWGCSSEFVRAYIRRPVLHLAGYRAKCEMALRFDARPWLAGIHCPTFILIGTWDPFVPTRAGQELAERLPNARLHQLAGGHLTHVVHPAAAGELIANWAASIPTGAGPAGGTTGSR